MNISVIEGCLDSAERLEECLKLQTFGNEELLLLKTLTSRSDSYSKEDTKFYITFIDRLIESEPADFPGDDECDAMHEELYRHIAERACNPGMLALVYGETGTESKPDYSVITVCETAGLLCRMGDMGMDCELYDYFDWDKTVRTEFGRRIAGTKYASMGLKRVYANVIKELMPERFKHLIPQECLPSAGREEMLQSMCQKNSNLASIIDRLKLE
jgi:hypothetical protein